MASTRAKTKKHPIQVKLADGSLFACPCGSRDFRITDDEAPLHLFCSCGQIYTPKDLPPLDES